MKKTRGPDAHHLAIKEEIKAKARAYYHKNKEKIQKYTNSRSRAKHLKRTYGLTLIDYDNLLNRQLGVCAICGSSDSFGHGRFAVDHNHLTGKVRGLLCSKCNTGLGFFKDSPKLLLKAVSYLSKEVI